MKRRNKFQKIRLENFLNDKTKNLFREKKKTKIKEISLSQFYRDTRRQETEEGKSETGSELNLYSILSYQRNLKNSFQNTLTQKSSPHKTKLTKIRRKQAPTLIEVIESRIDEIDKYYKETEKRSRRLIKLGDSGTKETNRFRVFQNNCITMSQDVSTYGKNIRGVYLRLLKDM